MARHRPKHGSSRRRSSLGGRATVALLTAGAIVATVSGFAAGVVVGEVHSGGPVSRVSSSYAASTTVASVNGAWTDIPGLSVNVTVPGNWKHALLLITFQQDSSSASTNAGAFRVALDGVGIQDPMVTSVADTFTPWSWQRQAVAAPGVRRVSVQYTSCRNGGCDPGSRAVSLTSASLVVLGSKS